MTGRRHRISASSATTAMRHSLIGKRALPATTGSAVLPQQHTINDSGQLKNDVEVRLQAVKESMENEHASIVKQIDAQSCKLRKRLKQDRQTLSAIAEAADTDWKNFHADYEEDTRENQKAIEVFFSKLNASSTHLTKTCIPELLKSVQMSMDAIKSRYARSAKPTRRLSAREKMNAKYTDIRGK